MENMRKCIRKNETAYIQWGYTFENTSTNGDLHNKEFDELEKDTVNALVNLFYDDITYTIKTFKTNIPSGKKRKGTIEVTFQLTAAKKSVAAS